MQLKVHPGFLPLHEHRHRLLDLGSSERQWPKRAPPLVSVRIFAAHLNRFTTDCDLDGVFIQLVITSRTSFFSHVTLHEFPAIPGTRAVGHAGRNSRYQNL